MEMHNRHINARYLVFLGAVLEIFLEIIIDEILT